MAVVDRPEIQLTARDATRQAFDSVKRSFTDLQRQAGSLQGAFSAFLGVLSAGAFASFVRSGIASAAALDDLSEKTSLTVETLSSLQRVAIIGGHSLDTIGGVAGKFARSVAEAAGGNKELIASFKALGISQQELQDRKFDENFLTFAKRIATAENQTYALAYATKLAGKNAAEALPFFKDLSEEGLKQATVTAAQAAAAEKLEKEFRRFQVTTEETKVAISLGLVPALNGLFAQLNDAYVASGNLAGSLRSLAQANLRQAFGTDAGAQIKEIRGELERVAKLREVFKGAALTELGLGLRESRLLEDLQAVRALQRQTALAGRTGPEFEDVRDIRARGDTSGFKLPPPPNEDAKRDAERAKAARLALTEAQAKAILDEEKRLAEVRLDLLERFYAEGLIAERDYWERRRQVQEAAIAASIEAVNREVEARQKALKEAAAEKGPSSAEALTAEKELLEARTRRAQLEQDLANTSVRSFLDAQRAAESYADQVRGLNARLAELSGRSAEAAAISFDQQNRTLQQRFESAGDAGGAALLQRLRAATVAQAQFNDERDRASELTQGLALQEERIQNSLRVGAISELEALRRTSSARQQSIEELRRIADAVDAAAAASGLPRLKLQAEELRVQLEALRAESDLVAQKFNTIFESGFTDALGDIASGAKSAKDAFKDMANSIVRDITRLAAQDVARQLFGGVGGGSGGLGGILAGIFGRGGGGGTPASLLAGGIVGFETGTPFVPRTGLYMLHRGESVTPAGQSSAGGGVVVNINTMPGGVDRRSAEQQAIIVGREVNRALRRTS